MKVFVITGTQEPFDRMVKLIDEWAKNHIDVEIIAQVSRSLYKAQNIKTFEFINPDEFKYIFNSSDLIIGHAGMGTIISALQNEKPIIVMPRLAKYREHRNDHQLATAKRMEELGLISVAYDKNQLIDKLNNLEQIKIARKINQIASSPLIDSIKEICERIK